MRFFHDGCGCLGAQPRHTICAVFQQICHPELVSGSQGRENRFQPCNSASRSNLSGNKCRLGIPAQQLNPDSCLVPVGTALLFPPYFFNLAIPKQVRNDSTFFRHPELVAGSQGRENHASGGKFGAYLLKSCDSEPFGITF